MAKKTNSLSFREIIQRIKQKKFSPVYLLMGEEDYYIDRIVDVLEKSVISEDEKDFNLGIYYGADSEVMQVMSRAQQYPVMADRQLVILKEAQSLFNAKKELEKLTPYVNHPNNSTVFVITYKGEPLPSTSSLVKTIQSEGGIVFKSEKPRDYELSEPLREYCRENGYAIDDKAVSLLCEYIGSPLSKLFGEVDKLIVSSGEAKKITPELIEAVTGISKDFNAFELVKALSTKDYPASMKIVSYFAKNPKSNPGVMVTATLFNYFSRLFIVSILKDKSDFSLMNELGFKSTYFLTDYKNGLKNYSASSIDSIIHAIREHDAKSKGIGSYQNEYELLKELIYKIFTLK